MRSSLRTRLLGTVLILMVVVGGATLFAIERTLADDLVSALDARLTSQGEALADWFLRADHPDRLVSRLAKVTGTQITLIGADGVIQADSLEPELVGRPIGDAYEVSRARKHQIGRTIRRLHDDGPQEYLVAVPADQERVIRIAVPLDDIVEARANMRNRLIVGGALGLLGALVLAFLLIRAVTRTEQIREQRDLLDGVIGGLVEGVVVVDAAGKIALVNDAARPLVGEALPAALAALVARALRGEPAEEELVLSGRTVRVSARPLQRAGAIAVLYDVTRMRALEDGRRAFLSNAAHELRTPVTSISGYAETLLGGAVDAETSREFLQTIHRNAQRISTLVTDLIVLDSLETRAAAVGERGAIALAQVVEDAVRTAKGVDAHLAITVDVPPELRVLGTRDGLDHVVQNLIDNASKYGGGAVEVRAWLVEERVRLEVSDRGPGIPVEHAERVFERFYRLDAGRSRDQGGSGLGLAIVKSQVEAIGGRVWVEPRAQGATLVVELDRG